MCIMINIISRDTYIICIMIQCEIVQITSYIMVSWYDIMCHNIQSAIFILFIITLLVIWYDKGSLLKGMPRLHELCNLYYCLCFLTLHILVSSAIKTEVYHIRYFAGWPRKRESTMPIKPETVIFFLSICKIIY